MNTRRFNFSALLNMLLLGALTRESSPVAPAGYSGKSRRGSIPGSINFRTGQHPRNKRRGSPAR